MNIGYGYNRSEQAFRAYECKKVFIDCDEKREERNFMLGLQRRVLRPEQGDVLVLLAPSDLGESWRDRGAVLTVLAIAGIPVQVRDGEPVLYDTDEKRHAFKDIDGDERTRRDAGRPAVLDPTPEQAKAFAPTWYDDTRTMSYCRAKFASVFGCELDEQVLGRVKYRFGPRNGSNKTRVAHLLNDGAGQQ